MNVNAQDNSLHRARLRRGMSLSDIAIRTLLSPRIVQKLDEGRFAELPGGVYARSYVRAFATVVGLEPEHVVQELADRLPPAEDPIPALRDVTRLQTPEWLRDLETCSAMLRSRLASSAASLRSRITPRQRSWPEWKVRLIASAFDAAILIACLAGLTALTARVAGVTLVEVLIAAPVPIGIVWAAIVGTYIGIFDYLARMTPGRFVSLRVRGSHPSNIPGAMIAIPELERMRAHGH